MKNNFLHRGQTAIEYSLLVACLVAALIAMQFYIKRAIQGRMRESADSIGEQYAPKAMSSAIVTTQTGMTTAETKQVVDPKDATKFGLQTNITTDETTTRAGYENVGKFENKLFD